MQKKSKTDKDTSLMQQQVLAYGKDLAKIYAKEKAKRKELEIANDKLQVIFESIPDGLLIIDANYIVQSANQALYKLLNVKSASISGKKLNDIADFQGLGVALMEMEHGKSVTGSHHIILSGNTKHDLIASISRIGRNEEKNAGWVILFRDITHQKRIENMKDEFISIISHEIRTPMTIISSYLSLLREELPEDIPEPLAGFFDEIEKANHHLNRTVTEMIEMSEIERETPLFTRKKTSLSGILKEAAAKAKPFAAQHRVEIILRLPKKRLYIKAVASQLESAVYHLLITEINFSHVGGRIICSLEETKTQIQIKIRDYGQGIPSREIPRIFTKFYQIEDYMTRTVDGLGLGLPLVKQIVSNHGGKIAVKSAPGKGSLFTLKFPKVQTEADILEEQVNLLRKRLSAEHKQSVAFAVDLKELLKKGK